MEPQVIRKRPSSIATAWFAASLSWRKTGPARRLSSTCESCKAHFTTEDTEASTENSVAILRATLVLSVVEQCLFVNQIWLRQKALLHLGHNHIIGIDHFVQMNLADLR